MSEHDERWELNYFNYFTEIEERFQQESLTHYSFREREQGHIVIHDGDEKREMPLMQLEIRKVTQQDGPFYDIRTLTEALG